MKTKIIFLALNIFILNLYHAQVNKPGTVNFKSSSLLNYKQISSGDSSIHTSYTQSACGLNYVQASNPLYKRNYTFSISVNQPAPFVISGIPSNAVILKAFLYSGSSGNSSSFSATVTNPSTVTTSYNMTLIGQAKDKCWGKCFTNTYRADVTNVISGNGTYMISGFPTSTLGGCANEDTDGATLFIIFSDSTKNYTGSIVLADGAHVITNSVTSIADTISNFNVCAPTTTTSNFMIISDLQKVSNVSIRLNSAVNNYTVPVAVQMAWNFITSNANTAVNSQSSAIYGISFSGDCNAMLMAGMYYRTCCLSCAGNNNTLISASSTPSCPTSNATVAASGLAPFTYTWMPGSQTTSVATGLSNGNYTVSVKDAAGCAIYSKTLNVVTCVGIAEKDHDHIIRIIFPNPAKENINIVSDHEFDRYEIYNATGSLIVANKFSKTINVSELPSGTYLINCFEGRKFYSGKFIIE